MRNGKIFQTFVGITLSLLMWLFSYANAGDLLITWDPNTESDLAGYKVYYGTSSRNYTFVDDVGNTTSHTATNLTDGVEYFIAVTAYDNADNESVYSEEVSAIVGRTDTIPPGSPTITGHKVKNLKITISWSNNNENDLAGYKVYYGTSSGNYPNVIDVGKNTSYTTPALNQGIEYFFVIRAYDTSNNESSYSNEYSVTISIIDTTPPSAPTISDYQLQQSKVHISWHRNSEPDVSGYKIYYGNTSRTYNIAVDVGMTTSYTTPDLGQGATYFFAITAYDTTNNESKYSTEIILDIPIKDTVFPTSPIISKLEIEERKVHLYWDRVSESELAGYKVYYGTSSRNYDVVEDVSNVTEYITGDLADGVKYYFTVTAYDIHGNESAFSNEMSADIPIIDITLPTIYAVEIRDSILVNLVFSEPVEKTSAEEISNYHINQGIQILRISLNENQRMVHITTTSHQPGILYTLTVSNVKDLAESPNVIGSNSHCTYQYNPEDHTPPFIADDIEVIDATHVNVIFSENIDRESAESEQNYSIDNGITIIKALLDNNLRVVHLTTSVHRNNTTYTLNVNNIKDKAPTPNVIAKNSTQQYTYYEKDNTPPAIYSAEIRSEDRVDVIFTEELQQISAENKENYAINNGITVLNAELDNNLKIVHLQTTAHQIGITYIITVNNIKDRAYPANIIVPNSVYPYTYAPEDITPPNIILVDCKDETHVDITFSEDMERESAEYEENYHINNGINVIEAILDNNRRVVHLTTTSHQSGQTYILTTSNVKDRAPVPNVIEEKNSSQAYTFYILDTVSPIIVDVIAVNTTTVEVVFSEIVNRLSAEISANYVINNDIQVLSATLYEDLKTVLLHTTEHEIDKFYVLTVNNVKDRAYPPNVIELNSTYEYSYESRVDTGGPIVSNFNYSNYQMAYLREGDFYYIDRSYVIESIPDEFHGLLWIKTSNNDRSNSDEEFFSFDLHKEAKIYVAYDSRAGNAPNWLKSNFSPINKYIGVSEYADQLELWEKDCPKGKITLGGNSAQGVQDAESMYVIIIRANKGDMPPQPIDTGDPQSLGPADFFLLFQNYPNPFNAGTEIRFQLPENCYVTLTIYNIIGQTVRRLVQGNKQASHHITHWDGRNNDGLLVPSGVYFSRLEVIKEAVVNNKTVNQVVYNDVRKMLFLK